MTIYAIGDCGRILFDVHRNEAARMVALGQARWRDDRRSIDVISAPRGEPIYGRTRTARRGVLAAIGRGQCYTLTNRQGMVTGLKRIFPEDRGLFHLATIEAMKA